MNKVAYIILNSQSLAFDIGMKLGIDVCFPELCVTDLEKLEASVNTLMEHGYVPMGGISIRHGSQGGAYFIQAMVKDDI